MYRNKFDKTGRASRRGARAEKIFKKSLDSFFGSNISYTDLDDGQLEHIDFRCKLGMTVDVKSMTNPDSLWIELKNVQGNEGWLYGDCTHFAFERKDFFQIVRKFDLINLVDELVDKDCMVESTKDSLYKVYSRKNFGRDDLISKIKFEDLDRIPHMIMKKNSELDIDLNPFL